MPSEEGTLRARTVPSAATISPRGIRSDFSSCLRFSGFSRSDEAWKIVHLEVKPTRTANITAMSPYRRMIGLFTIASFELPEFQATHERSAASFGAKGVVEQRVLPFCGERGGTHTGDEGAGVEVEVPRQPV